MENDSQLRGVLVINANVIMYPCIKLYFDEIAGNYKDATRVWQDLMMRKDIEKHLEYDANILKKINLCLHQSLEEDDKDIPKKTVKFFYSDSDFLKYIKNLEKELKDDKLALYNADFYHSLYSPLKGDRLEEKYYNKKNIMNWAGNLIRAGKVYEYTWFGCPNSPYIDPSIKDSIVNFPSVYNIQQITNLNRHAYFYNTIIIHYDESTVPYQYKHLFELIEIPFRGC